MIESGSGLRRLARAGSLVAVAAFALAGAAAAQDGAESHPVHIHAGTCAELGDVVAPLADVAAPTGEQMGPESALAVKISEVNNVPIPLADIIAGGHAINVHLSADEIDTYIACGDIGGLVNERENGEGMELTIGLGELNDSGYVGVAWLGDDGEGGANVGITLIEPEAMASGGEAAAQEAAPADAAAEAAAVEIKDFAYAPPSISVPVGGSITWTNADGVPHTATGLDRAALQSGAIASGASYSQTFATAGTYEYFCEFHPNMKGTIVVE